MEIRFWGAARTVTGSMHLLTIDGKPAAQYYQEKLDAAQASFAAHDYGAAKQQWEDAMKVKPLPPELGNTGDFNMLGLPAISIPCGLTKSGLPIGLQIVGPHFGEGRVLALAHAYERATPWHTRRPRVAGDPESR